MEGDERLPEWLIDDTASITQAQIWVTHTRSPRFFGELLCYDEAPTEGVAIVGLPYGYVVCSVRWVDPPVFDAAALSLSLGQAIESHNAIRESFED